MNQDLEVLKNSDLNTVNSKFQDYLASKEKFLFGEVGGLTEKIPPINYNGFYDKANQDKINHGRVELATIVEASWGKGRPGVDLDEEDIYDYFD